MVSPPSLGGGYLVRKRRGVPAVGALTAVVAVERTVLAKVAVAPVLSAVAQWTTVWCRATTLQTRLLCLTPLKGQGAGCRHSIVVLAACGRNCVVILPFPAEHFLTAVLRVCRPARGRPSPFITSAFNTSRLRRWGHRATVRRVLRQHATPYGEFTVSICLVHWREAAPSAASTLQKRGP